MEALSYLQKFAYPVMGKLPGATTEALSANEELELAAEEDFDSLMDSIEPSVEAMPSEESFVENPPAAVPAEEVNGLLHSIMAIGEESRASDPGAISVGALRGEDPGLEAGSSAMADILDTAAATTPAPEFLMEWALDMLTEKQKSYGIIPLLPEDVSECLDIYRNTSGITPEDFCLLKYNDNKLLPIAVAMLWGWIPAYRECHSCGSPMKLRLHHDASCEPTDPVIWRCAQEIPLRKISKQKCKNVPRKCNAKETPRRGTWLATVKAPMADVLLAIELWCSQQLNWETIGKYARLERKQIWRLAKACRLTAAHWMMQHPEANRIGGKDKSGNPITIQVDETFCGKNKYGKGAGKIQTWVLGGVEVPPKTEPDYIPKFFALTVPNRKKETLIPILKTKIRQDSVIWTDGWRAYFSLKKHFVDWDSVNHKKMFINENGVNTNRCEGIWKHMKKTIVHGTKREKIEEYVQLHNYKEYVKGHPHYKKIGMFGLLGRAHKEVILKDKGGQGDAIANMVTAQEMVTANPLPESELPQLPKVPSVRRPGRPSKRRRRNMSYEV